MKDLIDRRTAIDAVLDRMDVEKYGRNAKPEEIQWALEKLPSAQPERIRGRWQEDPSGYGFWICSNCGFVSEASAANVLYNFCPNCGAEMRGEQDG